jgi:hypothetical protein
MRTFDSGATRDSDDSKIDYEGFLSPLVFERYGKYMHAHRKQSDGGLRDSDNWQKGIPLDAYIKSAWRHFFDVWKAHRGDKTVDVEEQLCALMFNISGYLHERLHNKAHSLPESDVFFSGNLNQNLVYIPSPHPMNAEALKETDMRESFLRNCD